MTGIPDGLQPKSLVEFSKNGVKKIGQTGENEPITLFKYLKHQNDLNVRFFIIGIINLKMATLSKNSCSKKPLRV